MRFCLSNYQIDLNAVGETSSEVLANIVSLRPDSSQILPLHKLDLLNQQNGGALFNGAKSLYRIDFVIHGFRQVKNLVL